MSVVVPAAAAKGAGVTAREPTVEFAGWGRRAAAFLLDWLLIIVPFTLVNVLLAVAIDDPSGEGTALLLTPLFMAVLFVYFAVLNGRGGTLGKRALGIEVVDGKTGFPIGKGRGAKRELVRIGLVWLFYIPGVIDGLRPLWNPRHQSWHDSMVDSIVIHQRRTLTNGRTSEPATPPTDQPTEEMTAALPGSGFHYRT